MKIWILLLLGLVNSHKRFRDDFSADEEMSLDDDISKGEMRSVERELYDSMGMKKRISKIRRKLKKKTKLSKRQKHRK